MPAAAPRLSGADHARLVKLREIQFAIKQREGRRTSQSSDAAPLGKAVAAGLNGGSPRAVPSPQARPLRTAAPPSTQVQAPPMPSKRSHILALLRARRRAGERGDTVTLNRLCTYQGATAFLRQRRMLAYGRIQSTVNGIASARPLRSEVAAENGTQTEEELAAAADLMVSDEQALDDLAQADLAYLEMVRHKLGQSQDLTSSAEHALAESWQQLIMLRLNSQKMQLRQQSQPATMSSADMERVENEITQATARIGYNLQKQLAELMPHRTAQLAELENGDAPRGAGEHGGSPPVPPPVSGGPSGSSGDDAHAAASNGGAANGGASPNGSGAAAAGGGASPSSSTPCNAASDEGGAAGAGGEGADADGDEANGGAEAEASAAGASTAALLQASEQQQQQPTPPSGGAAAAAAALAAAKLAPGPWYDVKYDVATPWYGERPDGGRTRQRQRARGGAAGATGPVSAGRARPGAGAGAGAGAPRRAAAAPARGAAPSRARPSSAPPRVGHRGGAAAARPVTGCASYGATVPVPVQSVETLHRTIAQMERALRREDTNLSQLRLKLKGLAPGRGGGGDGRSQRQLENLVAALQLSHSELDSVQVPSPPSHPHPPSRTPHERPTPCSRISPPLVALAEQARSALDAERARHGAQAQRQQQGERRRIGVRVVHALGQHETPQRGQPKQRRRQQSKRRGGGCELIIGEGAKRTMRSPSQQPLREMMSGHPADLHASSHACGHSALKLSNAEGGEE